MKLLAKHNFQYNQTIPLPTVPVNGQALGAVSGVKFGVGTLAKCGCGVLAVFNALTLCGRKIPLQQVACVMESYRVMWGLLGVNCFALGKALGRWDIPAKKISGAGNMTDFLQKGRVALAAYWTKKPFLSSAHIVCLYGEGNGKARVYNLYSRRPYATVMPVAELYRRHMIAAFGITLHTACGEEAAH